MTAALFAVCALAAAMLPEVVVRADRAPERAPRAQDGFWLDASPAFSVRGQGEAGTIADASVNGSSFSEAGVVFNGASVRNAQTEHYNLDLPVASDWLGRPRVLTGLDLFREAAGHPAGSLSVSLVPPSGDGGRATAGAGANGLVFGRANGIGTFGLGASGRGWVGAFADAARADRIDGYGANAMDRASAGGRFGMSAGDWTFDALVACQERAFGCRGSYGANEKYPAWEKDRTGLVGADWTYDALDGEPARASVLWTRGRDDYRLYRRNPAFYRNTHVADAVTLHGATRRRPSARTFVDLRADADADVYSTTHRTDYTGRSPRRKTEDFRRFHASLAALPGLRAGGWELAAGASLECYSRFANRLSPAAGVTYRRDDGAAVSLSYREGLRQPSFTELTYDSPDSKGTVDLPLQRTRTATLDVTCAPSEDVRRARAGFFLMRSENLVDWLKKTPASSWKATALDPVVSFGVSGDAEWAAGRNLTLAPRAALVLKRTKTDCWSSRYAMDFPVASFSLEAACRILDGWRVSVREGVEAWKSNPVRRGPSVRHVSAVETECELPFCRGVTVSAGLTDLFNQAFETYPGQKALGFSGYAAVSWRF